MKQLLFLLFMLFLVACGAQHSFEEVEEETLAEPLVEEISSVDELIVQEKSIDYRLSADEITLLEERFDPEERAELSRPLVTNMQQGDVYVVGLAIRNILGQSTHDFVLSFDLVEMRDYSNSKHDTDDALLEAWFKQTNSGPYTMERSDEIIIPLIIEIGDEIIAGSPLLPGNYIFNVNVQYLSEGGMPDSYNTLELTVQIAE